MCQIEHKISISCCVWLGTVSHILINCRCNSTLQNMIKGLEKVSLDLNTHAPLPNINKLWTQIATMTATRRGCELSPRMWREIVAIYEGGMSFVDIGWELHMSEEDTVTWKIWNWHKQTPPTYWHHKVVELANLPIKSEDI